MENRPLEISEINRICGVRGCGNGPANGTKVYAIARAREIGPGMVILCEKCIKELHDLIATAPTEAQEKPVTKAKTTKSKKG